MEKTTVADDQRRSLLPFRLSAQRSAAKRLGHAQPHATLEASAVLAAANISSTEMSSTRFARRTWARSEAGQKRTGSVGPIVEIDGTFIAQAM